ncbi:MAG: acyl-CoA dehydrogenase family protein [Halioglobus sp.]|nr:acyl-CoA dehydrogenase family protein [Halioglobus sp.]
MFLEQSEKQVALRKEIRAYFSKLMTPTNKEAVRNKEAGDAYRDIIRQIGEDGWLTVGWPEEYGGKGYGAQESLIFFEETRISGAPFPFVTVNTVGPALIAHGSAAHKSFFLPKIATGELHFSIGYTEPNSGTDLASLSTSAVLHGDQYVINGNKIYTTSAEAADYVWLAARTDPDATKRHNGITIFMVSTDQAGYSFSPINTIGGARTNVTYYDNMRCPANMIAGELNEGWKLVTSQLNHERVGLAACGINALAMYSRVLAWARETQPYGGRPIDVPWVQLALAESHNILEAMRVMNWQAAWQNDQGEPDPAFSSAIKAGSSEAVIEVYRLLMDVLGAQGMLQRGSAGAILQGDLENEYRSWQINTFGGGVAEVMRDLVARFGLEMKAYKR